MEKNTRPRCHAAACCILAVTGQGRADTPQLGATYFPRHHQAAGDAVDKPPETPSTFAVADALPETPFPVRLPPRHAGRRCSHVPCKLRENLDCCRIPVDQHVTLKLAQDISRSLTQDTNKSREALISTRAPNYH
ncbi:hypothetical protein BS78_10G144600 [Paspalum vaginatum]|nr:hypothetical protein BS78_10G144600 [Paspalum vaginatum]